MPRTRFNDVAFVAQPLTSSNQLLLKRDQVSITEIAHLEVGGPNLLALDVIYHMHLVDVSMLNWDQARSIGNGEWSLAFDLGNDLVAKVGISITTDEAEAQQYIYERHNLALPVLGHKDRVSLPEHIRTMYCPTHGPYASESRRAMLESWEFATCSCNGTLDVLCMPKANPDISCYAGGAIERLIRTVDAICEQDLHRWWDPKLFF